MRERKKSDAVQAPLFFLLSHLLVARRQRRRATGLPRPGGNRFAGAPQLAVLGVVCVETLLRRSSATWDRSGNRSRFLGLHVLLIVSLLALHGLLQDLLPLPRGLQLRRQNLDVLVVAVKCRLRSFHHSVSHRFKLGNGFGNCGMLGELG